MSTMLPRLVKPLRSIPAMVTSRTRQNLTTQRISAFTPLGLVLVLVVTVGPVGGTASGAPRSPEPQASSEPQPEHPVMGEYALDTFRAAADSLDSDLVEAVERDLSLSPEEYLARAAAAADASEVVEYLSSQGINADDRQLNGTTLTIGVDTAAEAQAVEAAGADAVIGTLPQSAPIPDDLVFEPAIDVYGGDGISWNNFRCTVGVNGTNSALQPELVTAGHCTSTTVNNQGLYKHLAFSSPGFSPSATAQNVGVIRPGSFRAGQGFDAGLLQITQPGFVPRPYVTTYNGGQGARLGGVVAVRDTIIPTEGSPVCKSGGTTGWTCGTVLAAKIIDQSVGGYKVDVFLTDVCMLGGDSGGPALIGSAFVGINSGGAFGEAPDGYTGTPIQFCAAADDKYSVMSIMRHTSGVRTIETLYGSSWEPTVVVDSPTITLPATYTSGEVITVSGGIDSPNPRTRIHVTVRGITTVVSPNVSTGAWSAVLGPVSGADASITVQARWGQRSSSPAVLFDAQSGGAWSSRELVVERIAGSDRYDVSIGIAQRAYPSPAKPETVYVVNGGDYPDALSAGSAAAATRGVVMLVPSTSLLAKIRTELQRLAPVSIVIVGGPASVSPSVESEIALALPSANVSRISGVDRFEVSRKVLENTGAFSSATSLYVANGLNFPDALVAGAAGSAPARRSPVLTVSGPSQALPAATVAAIQESGISAIKIAGGPGSVSPSIETQLSNLPGLTTTRLGGGDRYDAARSVANNAYPATAGTVFLTTGLNFPDALTGAPLAGLLSAPMYSVQTSCVPRGVLDDLRRLKPTKIILLGGTGTLTEAVAALKPCA